MRRISLVVFTITLLIFTSIDLFAYGKTTIDPNLSTKNIQLQTDTNNRLSQKVTYEAKRKTVSSILADLSDLTGITLKAGYNNEDWQVRDRRMNIFAKDVPLASLMSSIARVMKFMWIVNEKDGVKSYRLYMDRKTLLDADAQKARNDTRVQEQLAKGRQELLESFENPDSASKEDAEKNSCNISLGTLCKEIPGLAEAVATGQEVGFSGSQLSLACKEAVLQIIQCIEKNSKSEELTGDIDSTAIRVNGARNDSTTLAQFFFTCGDHIYSIGIGGYIDKIPDDLHQTLRQVTNDWTHSRENSNMTPGENHEINNKYSNMINALIMGSYGPSEPLAYGLTRIYSHHRE